MEVSSSEYVDSFDLFELLKVVVIGFLIIRVRNAFEKLNSTNFLLHQAWNGLTLADLVFPWFVWMMGVSIVLSQRSLRNKLVSRPVIFVKIVRRTVILFFLGKTSQMDENQFDFH